MTTASVRVTSVLAVGILDPVQDPGDSASDGAIAGSSWFLRREVS
jgi:hypothetical protein